MRKTLLPLTFFNSYWTFLEPKSRCEHSEAVDGVFQQWWQQQSISHQCRFLWGQHAGSCSLLVKIYGWWWWLYKKKKKTQHFVTKNLLYQIALLCSFCLLSLCWQRLIVTNHLPVSLLILEYKWIQCYVSRGVKIWDVFRYCSRKERIYNRLHEAQVS